MSDRPPVRALPSDHARRALSVALAILTAGLWFGGVKAFAHTVTFSFSSAGYVIVPLGMFICGIFLIPLMSQVHKQWILGDPHRRDRQRVKDEAEEKRMRLSTQMSPSERRRLEAEANRQAYEESARARASGGGSSGS